MIRFSLIYNKFFVIILVVFILRFKYVCITFKMIPTLPNVRLLGLHFESQTFGHFEKVKRMVR